MCCGVSSVIYCQRGLGCNTCEWDHKAPSCYQPFNKKRSCRNKVWWSCVVCELEASLCPGSAGQPSPQRPAQSLANPLQQAVYSKRIISPIPWCHCKATVALPHAEPRLLPLLTLGLYNATGKSLLRFKPLSLQAGDDRSVCTGSDARFILQLFHCQDNWQTAHRKQKAICCEQRCHIKLRSHLFFDADVLPSLAAENFYILSCLVSSCSQKRNQETTETRISLINWLYSECSASETELCQMPFYHFSLKNIFT